MNNVMWLDYMLAGHGARGHQRDYGTVKRVLCAYEVAKSRAV
jgi:hypothetical protein